MADTLDMTPRDGSRWRHKKRGSTYTVMGVASAQVVGVPIEEGATAVVYRSEHDGSLWLRPAAEFMDGRFEPLSEATPRADDMPEMVPDWKTRAKRIKVQALGWNQSLDGVKEAIEQAFRDGWDARVLAERSRTAEPSASALETARDMLTAIPGGPGYYDREVVAVAAAITAAREAAIRECAEIAEEQGPWASQTIVRIAILSLLKTGETTAPETTDDK